MVGRVGEPEPATDGTEEVLHSNRRSRLVLACGNTKAQHETHKHRHTHTNTPSCFRNISFHLHRPLCCVDDGIVMRMERDALSFEGMS